MPRSLPAGGLIVRREDQLTILLVDAISRSLAEWQARLPAEASAFHAVVRVAEGAAELVTGC